MTTFRGTKSERNVLGAFVSLMRGSESLFVRAHEHLEDEGLSVAEFAVLEVLHHVGDLTQIEIGRRVLRSRGSITMTVDKLEERGLVKRDRGTEDRRCICIRLTPDGREKIVEVFKKHLGVLVKEMSILTEEEKEQLRVICKKLA